MCKRIISLLLIGMLLSVTLIGFTGCSSDNDNGNMSGEPYDNPNEETASIIHSFS